MLLFGIGTPQAVTAGLVYLLAHACYKGALFLVAGAVEHETGTRDVASLGGLRRAMPLTAIAAALAAGSMAGIPLFAGFIAKEQFYDSISTFGASGHLERCPRLAGRRGEHVPWRRRADRRHRAVSRPFDAGTRARMTRRRRCGWDHWSSVRRA